ncbi:MAG: hypothetical protein KC474_04600 [Cyanobacteria bacterium HKST-UBA04]|nr:hypothetical protein [Cyanobacteria bacterium HKST-UBA04]MCA9841453.1 hypothetical protein [Cyanobacteria bacterium HKST-UBA03]
MKQNKQIALTLLAGAAMMAGASMLDQPAQAADNMFSLNEVSAPILLAKGDHHKCGAGACGGKDGDKKCGGKHSDKKCGSKDGDKKCGGKDSGEHKCGAGACGSKDGDKQCGSKDGGDHKCGAGACGGKE